MSNAYYRQMLATKLSRKLKNCVKLASGEYPDCVKASKIDEFVIAFNSPKTYNSNALYQCGKNEKNEKVALISKGTIKESFE